jgi:insertion element IS1 protein InsB
VKKYSEKLPKPTVPKEVRTAELDEVFSFIGDKKRVYILTIVDRETRCLLGVKVVWERTRQAFQNLVDFACKSSKYFSDAYNEYARLLYHGGRYEVSDGKRDTYSVEGDNSELRHYLARLARSSRCFSRYLYALICVLRLFIYAFNRRQLYKH